MAFKALAVQILEEAFSRLICCSRVCKAKRNADKQRQDDCENQGPALLERIAAQQRRTHHDCAERQVDTAGDDDERHAEGHEADIIAGFENILDRIERQEVIAED